MGQHSAGIASGRSSALAASQRNVEAFADFYTHHADAVLAYFRRRAGNAEVAFDLFAETFAKALERRRQFRGTTVAEERAWLFAIARTELLQFWRDGTIENAALERLGVEPPQLMDPEIERIDGLVDVSNDMQRALADLPDAQRHAIELRVLGEERYTDVSRALGISTANARTHVSRGLRALGHALRPTNEVDRNLIA